MSSCGPVSVTSHDTSDKESYLFPINNPEIPPIVTHGHVAGSQPAIGIQGFSRGSLVPPVAETHVGSSYEHLSRAANTNISAVIVDEATLAIWVQLPDTACVVTHATWHMEGAAGDFGHAPALIDLQVEPPLAFVLKISR